MKYSLKSTDQDLIKGCRSGNRLAQRFLYERYFGKMLGIAMRYTKQREEAVAILNNAFFKVFTSLEKYNDQNNLAGWIAKIVFNASIDYVRKHTKYRQVMNFEVEKDKPVLNESIYNLDAEYLYDFIQKLPSASQAVFSLYVIEGYKHREIGEILGITEGTSKWHLANARKELKRMVEQHREQESSYQEY